MKLNLGSCDLSVPGFLSVDICPPADIIADLSQRWPWPDSSVSEVMAKDVIEHIADRIHFMNELHRVMRAGGRATVVTPNAAKGGGYFQDPTHKAPWTLNSFKYFAHGSLEWMRFHRSYGITAHFRVIELEETSYQDGPVHGSSCVPDPVYKIRAVLEAVK